MDFLTQEHVKQEAAKGELAALKCSLLHHEQGRDAGKVELINALKKGEFELDTKFCACCQKFRHNNEGGCNKCTLGYACCENYWSEAAMLLRNLIDDYSNANFKAFQEAATDLCTYIEGKIAECEAKEKKPEVTYSIGDRFKGSSGEKDMIAITCKGVGMVDLKSGCLISGSHQVNDSRRITQKELGWFQGGPKTRYWDAQKKEYTDGRDDKKECKCKSLDKPEVLRHGDYGLNEYNNAGLIVKLDLQGVKVADKDYVFESEGAKGNAYRPTIILGNIFDDLAALSEPLREFKMKESFDPRYTIDGEFVNGKVNVRITAHGNTKTFRFTNQELHDFILNLRRMEVTLKGKER